MAQGPFPTKTLGLLLTHDGTAQGPFPTHEKIGKNIFDAHLIKIPFLKIIVRVNPYKSALSASIKSLLFY
jgi:hypothetical protein